MNEHESVTRRFFADYEARFNEGLQNADALAIDQAVASFAEFFVEASPAGVTGGKPDHAFRVMLPKAMAFYRSIGIKAMTIAGLDITPIDDMHVLARVSWVSRCVKKDDTALTIDFQVVYVLQVREQGPKIFAYVTGDEQKALRRYGLIPEATGPILKEKMLDAPVLRVWRALTDKNEMKEWFAPVIDFTPEAGFQVRFKSGIDGMVTCTVVEAVEGTKLVLTWRYDDFPHDTTVTIELLDAADKTSVLVLHDGLANLPLKDSPSFWMRQSHAWDGMLGKLQEYIQRVPFPNER